MRPNFFHHLHPPTIPRQQSRWTYTLGAGGTAIFLLLVLLVTGALEMFYYTPTPEKAALSVQAITYHVAFGGLVRNIHYWAAQLLIVVIAIHLARIVFTGAYRPPRRFNYLLGLTLFVMAVLANFTGYILRWDQGIQWALVVGTNLLKTIPGIGNTLYRIVVGESHLGPATLIRFYVWHVFGLTLVLVIVTGWHIFRVRSDGGIAVPPPAQRTDQERITRYELVHREVLAMLLTGAALIVIASFAPAPIDAPIKTLTSISGNLKAPWFFLWVQAMLKWGDPFVWGVLAPLVVLIVLALIPYLLPLPHAGDLGRWFPPSNRLAQIVFAAASILFLALTSLFLVSQ